jgi:hypothetical protein
MVQVAAEIGGLTTVLCNAFACGTQRRAASSTLWRLSVTVSLRASRYV